MFSPAATGNQSQRPLLLNLGRLIREDTAGMFLLSQAQVIVTYPVVQSSQDIWAEVILRLKRLILLTASTGA